MKYLTYKTSQPFDAGTDYTNRIWSISITVAGDIYLESNRLLRLQLRPPVIRTTLTSMKISPLSNRRNAEWKLLTRDLLNFVKQNYLEGLLWSGIYHLWVPNYTYVEYLNLGLHRRWIKKTISISPTSEQSMWAQLEQQNFRSPLKPIYLTPAPRSATSRGKKWLDRERRESWSLAPSPLPLQSTFSHPPNTHQFFGPLRSNVSSSKPKKWIDFHSTYMPICVH